MRKLRSFLVTLMFIGVFAINMVSLTQAKNGENITLGRGIITANTGYERKINNSSVYAKCVSAAYENTGSKIGSCKGIVQGSNGNTSSSVGNPGNSPTYDFSVGQSHYMINFVYEDGYPFARIHFRATYNAYYTIFTFNWGPMSAIY